MSKKSTSPFSYFGSKQSLSSLLVKNLPPHNCWVEAFCGSASLTFKKGQSPIEVINDIDGQIMNFFEQLRKNPSELIRQIELTPYSEDEFKNSRITKDNLGNLEKARRFIIQAMMAINGVFGDERGGFSYSDSYVRNGVEARVNRWNNLPNRLIPIIERLKSIRIENKDARRLIKRYVNRPATLLYLDPPYFAERTQGYNIDANDLEFHTELLDLISNAKCMIFISGYNNSLYRERLSKRNGWKVKRIKCSTVDSNGLRHIRTEYIWMNKYYCQAVKTKKIPIRLSKTEIKQNKLNPKRK